MTQNQNTEPATELEGDALVKDLRAQLKARPKEDEVQKRIDNAVAEALSARDRDDAIKSVLIARDVPAGVSELVAKKLGESDVTEESVAEVLTTIGFDASPSGGDSSEKATEPVKAEALAGVTDLANQVKTSGEGGSTAPVADQFNAAQSREEILEIAAREGLLTEAY